MIELLPADEPAEQATDPVNFKWDDSPVDAQQVIDEDENTFSNLFVTGDLAVFSKVLINSVMRTTFFANDVSDRSKTGAKLIAC